MLSDNEKLKQFNKFRKESIEMLKDLKITKNEFLDKNYEYIQKINLKPFSKIDSLDKAIYNYQYYNILAKRSNNMALKTRDKHKKMYKRLINQRENYYCLKDEATISILDIIKYKEIESYFINVKSKRLTGKIFEINAFGLDKVILHSKNPRILKKLKENNVFDDKKRDSLIDSYVNRAY
ncbi:MAG: hypothetical protein Q4B52_01940 [Tissierellia bacterium]|nr:hypothetical protein [Tissierellia bacterium]